MAIKDHNPKQGKRHVLKRDYSEKQCRSSRPWRRIRQRVLIRDTYKCQKCGIVDAHMEVDHIIPLMKGGDDKESNLQTLCKICHALKTSNEIGFVKATMLPKWLPKTIKPVTVVCGRPAAGKSTYASQHMQKGDLIIDLDLMAREIKRELYELTENERYALIRMRNERIEKYFLGQTNHHRLWLLAMCGRPHHREFWQEKGCEVVVINTPTEVCERRILAQDIPTWRKMERIEYAKKWK